VINLRQLEVFTAVMRRNSISEAARELGVTQPAVSKVLRHTEELLGFKLFERIRGGLYPTPEARALFAEAEPIYGGLTTLRRLAGDLRDTQIGLLRLAVVPAIAFDLVPDALVAFKTDRPHVHIELLVRLSQQVADLINTQQADLGIVHFTDDNPLIQAEVIGSGRIVCVMHADHPLAARQELTPHDLADQPLISYARENRYGEVVEEAFRAAGVRLRPVIETNMSTVACSMAAKQLGIALVDEFTSRSSAFHALAVRPLTPPSRINVGLLYPRFRPLSRLAREFVQCLKAELATQWGKADEPAV